MNRIFCAALLAAVPAIAATPPLAPATVTITTDPAVAVKVTGRTTNTSKTVTITVNKQDTVIQNGKTIFPVSVLTNGVDLSKLVPGPTGTPGTRIASVWYDPTNNNALNPACTDFSPTCDVPPVYKIAPSDFGAFRVNCPFAKMARTDPLVMHGMKDMGHVHTYFGNTGVDENSTGDSLRALGNSTCNGGDANKTAYWTATIIDTATGTPIAARTNEVYYKDDYRRDISKVVEPIPIGLGYLMGNSKNTDPAAASARWTCIGAENGPTGTTIPDAMVGGKCIAGNELLMTIQMPHCWDGVHLDSADHKSHVVDEEQYRDTTTSPWSYPWRCPADHPHVFPNVSFNVHWTIPATGIATWKLSSDLILDPTLPGGTTAHGDILFAWDQTIMRQWITNCLRANTDCHDSVIQQGLSLAPAP